MAMHNLLLKGLIIGFSIAAPVGPIGVLCIKRSLSEGRMVGFISGLGAAAADAVYGFIAGAGLSVITSFLLSYKNLLGILGGVFLLYLALKTFMAKPAGDSPQSLQQRGSAFLSTFFLTLTNPMTILSFIAIFAGLGMGSAERSFVDVLYLVLGVFMGSAFWWLCLSGFASFFRAKLNQNSLVWINRISGLIIGAFGVYALSSSL